MYALLLTLIALAADVAGTYSWDLPKGFPPPRVPAGNPMTAAKAELGRYLFNDTRMSVNGKTSCATVTSRNSPLPTGGRRVLEPPAKRTHAAP